MELRQEQRRIVINSAAAMLFCAALLAAGYALLPSVFSFPEDASARLAFVLRADLFILLWVLLGVRLVASGRFHSIADIRGSAYSAPTPAIAIRAAFLQNTLEQAFLAVGVHLALATLLSGPALSLIVVSVMLFSIGRVAFLIRYAEGAGARAFGMVTTAFPILAGFGLALVLMVRDLGA